MLNSNWKYVFPDIDVETENTQNEIAVHCPFHNDSVRSAHLNTELNLLHCKTCGKGWNLKQIINKSTSKILRQIKNKRVNITDWSRYHTADETLNEIATKWIFKPETLKQLKVKRLGEDEFSVPFFTKVGNNELLLAYSSYQPNRHPKWLQSKGSLAGLIFPQTEWEKSNETTFICAGPKDALIARSFGLNAITFSGGEQALPANKDLFKGRDVVIIYDNDEAGIKGGQKVAQFLSGTARSIKVITNIFSVIREKGEDLYDFFTKYRQNRTILLNYVQQQEFFTPIKIDKFAKLRNIKSATDAYAKQNKRLWVKSNIKVISQLENAMEVPSNCEALIMTPDHEPVYYEWALEEEDYEQIFSLILVKKNWEKVLATLIKNKASVTITSKTKVKIKITEYSTVQSFSFSFLPLDSDADSSDVNPNKLMVGYICDEFVNKPNFNANDELEIIYKVVSDEKTNVVALIKHYRSSSHFLDNFDITDGVKESLKLFQPATTTTVSNGKFTITNESVRSKLEELWNRSRDNSFTRNFIRFDLFLANELVFCSPWRLKFINVSIPAVLDILIVGDTETGKSTTANGMISWYNQGKSVNLSSATKIALLGGTKEIGGKKFTFVGTIPSSHKRLIVMEEYETVLSKNSSGDMDKFMLAFRDVRSKGEISIERAQGSIRVPCKVRTIIISNAPKGQQINSFENGGYGVIHGLRFENPDIGRFTFAMLVNQKELVTKDENIGTLTPFDKRHYRNRLQWIWTRKEENIIINKDVELIVNKEAKKLFKKFYVEDFPLVGQKIDEKLVMISTAIACTLCSTTDFINVDVKKEHVDAAVDFINSLYASSPFDLDKYVKKQEEFSAKAVNDNVISIIHAQYQNIDFNTTMDLIQSKSTIKITEFKFWFDSDNNKYNKFLGWMLRNCFVKMNKNEKEILITEKFKEGFRQMKESGLVSMPTKKD